MKTVKAESTGVKMTKVEIVCKQAAFDTLKNALMSVGILTLTVTPAYATIGVLAPILVLFGRLLQGFSAGAELGNHTFTHINLQRRPLAAYEEDVVRGGLTVSRADVAHRMLACLRQPETIGHTIGVAQ